MNLFMKRAWGITTVALLALTGCAPSTTATPAVTESAPASSLRDRIPSQEQTDALLAYVKAEQATVPNLMANMPGLYSEITVEGGIRQVIGPRILSSDGTAVAWHAEVVYSYRYLPDVDLSRAPQQLEATRAQIERLCETTIFPSMRVFGVDTPITVLFRYHAADRILSIKTLECSTFR